MCTEVFPITEWFPIWDPSNLPGSVHGLGAAAATAALVAWRRRRVRWEEVAPAAAAFASCFVANRFILLLGPAVVPVWVRCLTPPGADDPTRPPDPPRVGRTRWALFLALMMGAVAVPYVVRPPLHAPYEYPFAGIAELRKRTVTGTVYVYYFWGGVVSDLGYPDWKVSHDGRYSLHSDEAWRAYFADDLAAFEAFHPAAAILDQKNDKVLIDKLRTHPDFDLVHEDKLAVTFVRASGDRNGRR
jgi:hypothetical protein